MKDLEEFKKSIYDKKNAYEAKQKRKKETLKKLSLRLVFLLLPAITIAILFSNPNTQHLFTTQNFENISNDNIAATSDNTETSTSDECVLESEISAPETKLDFEGINNISIEANGNTEVLYPKVVLEASETNTLDTILDKLSSSVVEAEYLTDEGIGFGEAEVYYLTVTYEDKIVTYSIYEDYIHVFESDYTKFNDQSVTNSFYVKADTNELIELIQSLLREK